MDGHSEESSHSAASSMLSKGGESSPSSISRDAASSSACHSGVQNHDWSSGADFCGAWLWVTLAGDFAGCCGIVRFRLTCDAPIGYSTGDAYFNRIGFVGVGGGVGRLIAELYQCAVHLGDSSLGNCIEFGASVPYFNVLAYG